MRNLTGGAQSLKRPASQAEGSALDPTRNFQVAASTGRSLLTLGHYTHSDPRISRPFRTRSEDACMLVYEFFDHPSHPILVDGLERMVGVAPGACIKIYDLRHVYEVEHSYPLMSIHMHIPQLAMQDLFAETGASPPAELRTGSDSPVRDEHIHGLADTLRRLAVCGEREDALFRDHLLFAVTYHVASCYGDRRSRDPRKGGLAPWQLRRAKELIAARAGAVEILDLARECRLSTGYFARAFKVSTGVTPHRWLNDYRIERAKQFLARSGAPLSEIARTCGYADQSHFTKVFNREVGTPPGAWRRRLKA